MATRLDKDLIRESTDKSDDREIIVTLSANQEIKLKLKGMKSGEVKINIKDLYNHLTGKTEEDVPETKASGKQSLSIVNDDEDEKPAKSGMLIDLNDLRSMNAISMLDVPTKSKFDGIIADLVKQRKEVLAAVKNVKSRKK